MSNPSYPDFSITIYKQGENYKVRVTSSPFGPLSEVSTDSFDLNFCLESIGEGFRSPSLSSSVNNSKNNELKPLQIGKNLYDSFFIKQVHEEFQKSISRAKENCEGRLRIFLNLTEAPELVNLPWEYLNRDGFFYSLNKKFPIIRTLNTQQIQKKILVDSSLNVLVVVSMPKDVSQLNSSKEVELINKSFSDLKKYNKVKIDLLENATFDSLQDKLRDKVYHVIHYIGHSDFDEKSANSYISLENESGINKNIKSNLLKFLLSNESSIRLVILNSCEGSKASEVNPFSGTAQVLLKAGIPAVIAMQYKISDTAAIKFSKIFYDALVDGYSVDSAITEARVSLCNLNKKSEWGTPTLYMGAQNSVLFEVETNNTPNMKKINFFHTREKSALQTVDPEFFKEKIFLAKGSMSKDYLNIIISDWYNKRHKEWPDDVKIEALGENLSLYYVPYWVVDFKTMVSWSADIPVYKILSKECIQCSGSGFIDDSLKDKCSTCHGVGAVEEKELIFWDNRRGRVSYNGTKVYENLRQEGLIKTKLDVDKLREKIQDLDVLKNNKIDILFPKLKSVSNIKKSIRVDLENYSMNKVDKKVKYENKKYKNYRSEYKEITSDATLCLSPVYLGYYKYGQEILDVEINGITGSIYVQNPKPVRDAIKKRTKFISIIIAILLIFLLFIVVASG